MDHAEYARKKEEPEAWLKCLTKPHFCMLVASSSACDAEDEDKEETEESLFKTYNTG